MTVTFIDEVWGGGAGDAYPGRGQHQKTEWGLRRRGEGTSAAAGSDS